VDNHLSSWYWRQRERLQRPRRLFVSQFSSTVLPLDMWDPCSPTHLVADQATAADLAKRDAIIEFLLGEERRRLSHSQQTIGDSETADPAAKWRQSP